MPAYTKFNKKKKVMATLQVVDKTDTTHNYKNKDVLGHEDRTKDSDVDSWYSKSVFSEATSTDSAADEQHSDVTANAVDSTTKTSETETTPSVSKLKRSVAK